MRYFYILLGLMLPISLARIIHPIFGQIRSNPVPEQI